MNPLWNQYNEWSKKLSESATKSGSSPLAQRRNIEQNYGMFAQKLMQAGKMYKIKRKYRR